MTHERKDYKEEPPVISITKTTIDILLKQDNFDQLITLYLFYCYVSAWQNTLQIHATTSYTAKGIGWSEQKVKRVKKRLIELELVKDVQTRNEKHITGHYIRVFYIPNSYTPQEATGSKMLRVAETTPKCLVTGNNKCLVTHSHPKMGDSKTTPSPFDGKASERLYKIIKSHINININTSKWPDIFRRLRTVDKISKARIKDVLNWYKSNIGDKYTPVAHSAVSFREKFTRLESAMFRYNKKHYGSDDEDDDGGEPVLTYRMGGDGEMGYYDDN